MKKIVPDLYRTTKIWGPPGTGKTTRLLKILKEKCDQKFGFSSPRENKEMTLIQYDTAFLMVGIQMIKPKNREINFRVGNKALWARIFKEELESS